LRFRFYGLLLLVRRLVGRLSPKIPFTLPKMDLSFEGGSFDLRFVGVGLGLGVAVDRASTLSVPWVDGAEGLKFAPDESPVLTGEGVAIAAGAAIVAVLEGR
jgi:hypothetical protein